MAAVRHKGGPSLRDLKAQLVTIPARAAVDIAAQAAPAITAMAQASFDGGVTVYGDARPAGVNGDALSLRRSGATRRSMSFTSAGRILRCVLGPSYARYLVGKYSILPNGDRAAIPTAWRRRIEEITARVLAPAGAAPARRAA